MWLEAWKSEHLSGISAKRGSSRFPYAGRLHEYVFFHGVIFSMWQNGLVSEHAPEIQQQQQRARLPNTTTVVSFQHIQVPRVMCSFMLWLCMKLNWYACSHHHRHRQSSLKRQKSPAPCLCVFFVVITRLRSRHASPFGPFYLARLRPSSPLVVVSFDLCAWRRVIGPGARQRQ